MGAVEIELSHETTRIYSLYGIDRKCNFSTIRQASASGGGLCCAAGWEGVDGAEEGGAWGEYVGVSWRTFGVWGVGGGVCEERVVGRDRVGGVFVEDGAVGGECDGGWAEALHHYFRLCG
jgi:hypothetical protein